jgi:extracellular factor (EF) 3-hydroxypalmitic acid methyl ester biosynthesis protein
MEISGVAKKTEATEGIVVCRNSQGLEVRATLVHFTRYTAVFEVYTASPILRASEVLSDFKMTLNGRLAYSGKGVVSNLINAGAVLLCEANLEEGWIDLTSGLTGGASELSSEFQTFLTRWQGSYKVLPEFKLVVADMQALLADMHLWLDQVELAIRASPNGERIEMLREAAHVVAQPAVRAIEALGDRFEEIAGQLTPEMRPPHIHFTRRHLHSTLLSSPFAYRTFYKPLGYAGDYEMVNMIQRDPYEGGSLFARVVNAWFLQQLPAEAHRNPLKILKQKLIEEAARTVRLAGPARIFNLGCGPAAEINDFLAESELSSQAQFTLLDFNEETIEHTGALLRETCRRFGRKTVIQLQKKSVQQLLREAARAAGQSSGGKFDYVYCAGLFDYLPDRICKQLLTALYDLVAPGGLLLATNVDGTRPFRNKLEFILDWNLIYRTGAQLAELKPETAPAENSKVTADFSGVNVFLEIRKPGNG